MDELTSTLATAFNVTNEPNTTAAQHPRFSEYKPKGNKHSQEDRRKFHLKLQKERRYDYSALARNLALGSWGSGDACQEDHQSMDCEVTLRKPGRHYKNQLMFSEWLVEVPEDFESEWLMVICPVGKRSLIVASKGSTSAFAKNGYKRTSFPSLLPGGNRQHKSRTGESAILDCIFDEVNETIFVLDMMSWKSHPLYDSETEFRFYWLHTKFSENPELCETSTLNKYKFLPLPSFPCTKQVISQSLAAVNFAIDGLLFFHKRAHYIFGATPLVVWLKPYMLPEILGITEPSDLLSATPAGYSNYANHLESEKGKPYGPNYHRKNRQRKSKGAKKQDKMEVGQSESPDTSVDGAVVVDGEGDSRNSSVLSEDTCEG